MNCTLVDRRKTTAYFKLECGAPSEVGHLVADFDQLATDDVLEIIGVKLCRECRRVAQIAEHHRQRSPLGIAAE